MKVNIYNQKGENIGQTELPAGVFGVKVIPDLLHQVVISQQANRRQGTAHTKGRGEVSGGGKKPWRQKGTGRARHGSTRSPIWKGGGVAFGPTRERVYKRIIPKIMAKKAILMTLSVKAQNNLLIVLDDLNIPERKTKAVAQILNKLPAKGKTALVALANHDPIFVRAARNIPKIATMQVKDFNALDLLSCQYLILSEPGIAVLEKMFAKK